MPPRAAASGSQATSVAPGIIAVNPGQLQQKPNKVTSRLKIEVRRLPPSLTRNEFEDAIGDEWKIGDGKVDWVEYRQGKVRGPGKHPEQSRAYLHLTSDTHMKPFEAKFLSATFHDAKGTWRHPDLKALPPSLEYASCQRVPSSKHRLDNRQGLIDQDPEYMAFLESETQLVPKAPALDAVPRDRAKELVTSTPLIDALREKKAAKAKAAAAKASKNSKDEPTATDRSKAPATKGRKAGSSSETKAASKQEEKIKDPSRSSTKADKGAATDAMPPIPGRKRERTPANIKSMLQRDLGLINTPRRGAKDTASTDKNVGTNQPATVTTSTPAGPSSKGTRPGKKDKAEAKSSNAKNMASDNTTDQKQKAGGSASAGASPQPTKTAVSRQKPPSTKVQTGGTKAFIKHANASQGVTEELLRAALSGFGEIVSVEIDKRKGTALAEFKTAQGLATAMSKRTLPVAAGAVEVLEYRDKSLGQAQAKPTGSANRGQSSRGRGRGAGRNATDRPNSSVGLPTADKSAPG